MSLWWMWGTDSGALGTSEVNAPSLWSGGVKWDGTAPEAAYWQTTEAATDRTGTPALSVAVGGVLVTSDIHSVDFQLGRDEWLRSVLSPSSASLEFEGAITGDVMDDVVIGVMSDVTDQHSAALWVGYADTVAEAKDTSGRIVTNVSCVDVVGLLGQAGASVVAGGVSGELGYGSLAEVVERLLLLAGVGIDVVDISASGAGATRRVGVVSDGSGSLLDLINKAETAVNGMIVLSGKGHLLSYYRTDDAGPTPTVLDPQSELTRGRALSDIINEWRTNDHADTPTTGEQDSIDRYGVRSYDPDREFLALGNPYQWLRDGEWLLTPRWTLSGASFPITDLSDPVLFRDPLDWIELDSEGYQLLSLSHSIRPGKTLEWTVSITGDTTPVVIAGG